jgi:hypothetical protein
MILCRTCDPAAHAGAPAAGAVAAAAVGAAVGAVAAAADGGWALQLMLFLHPLAFQFASTKNDWLRMMYEVNDFVTRVLPESCSLEAEKDIQSAGVLKLQTSLRDLHLVGQSDHDLQAAFNRCIMINPATLHACCVCGNPPSSVFSLWDQSVVMQRLVVSTDDRFSLQGALGEHVLCTTCMQARYIVLHGTFGIL